MKKILSIILVLSVAVLSAQTYTMQDGSVNTCSGTFFDSGGGAGNYGNNEDFVFTICPDAASNVIQVDFTTFTTQLGADILTIYDGDSTAAPSLGSFSGTGAANSPGFIQATSSSGCLTFEWTSDFVAGLIGWEAEISCSFQCQDITASIDSTVPPWNAAMVVEADINDPITFNGSGTFSISGAGAVYNWDFGDGNSAMGQTVMYSYAAPGIYNVDLTITDPNGCTNSNTEFIVAQIAGGNSPGNPFVDAGDDITLDCSQTCTDLVASFQDIGETNTYTVTQIPFEPPFQFEGLSNSINTNIDDAWSGVEALPFEFCFFTDIETQFQVGSNGVVRFDVDPGDTGPGSNDWSLSFDIPNNTDDATSEPNVFGVGHDIDPSVNNVNEIAWEIIGTAPNRVLAVSYFEVPMFSCNNLTATHMMVFYETTNVIDVYVLEKQVCAWNNGNALIGIQNDAGTEAFVPPNRNTLDPDWTVTDEAWRFTPAGPSVVDFAWLDSGGNVISTNPVFNVCITGDSETFTARAIYTNCNGDVVEVTDDVVVSTSFPFTVEIGDDLDLCEGDADVILDADIGSGTATYQWALNGVDIAGETNPTLTVSSPNSGTYSVSVTDQACTITDTTEVTFYPLPIINPITDYELCDDNVPDGLTEFELGTKYGEILGGQTGVTVTFHETQDDADMNTNPLNDVSYTNTSNPQTIYVRLENDANTDCYVTTTFQLEVVGITFNTALPDLEQCDDDFDGFASFDLTVQDAEVSASSGFDIADLTITYHETQDDANNGVNPLASPYVNTTNPQTIYVRAVETLNIGCFGVAEFDLIVNPLPTIVTPTPLEVCDDGVPDGITDIDLTLKNQEITGGNPDYTVSYYETQADADAATNALSIPYTNTSNPQTVYVRVENINTGCYTTTLDLVVEQAPTANTPTPLEYCDADNDGFGVFTLTDADAEIIGGQTGLVVTYHETLANAENNVEPLMSPYVNIVPYNQTVYVRVESETIATDCATIVELQLIVHDTPLVPAVIDDYVLCDMDYDGIVQFDLTLKDSEILGSQDPMDLVLTYHLTQADADSGASAIVNLTNYTNLSNPQTIYVRLESIVTGCVTTGAFDLVVDLPPLPVQPTPLELCDDEVADEITVFDLTLKDAEITAGDGSWDVQYYETGADAQSDSNAIDPASSYTNTSVGGNPANPQTLFVRVTDTDTGCVAFTTLTIRVLPNPTPGLDPDDLHLCDDTNSGDMVESFDLTVNEVYIINGEMGVSATYHESLEDAEDGLNAIADPTAYDNTSTPQTIYVRVTNDTTGCYTIVDFDIVVDPLPETTAISDEIICEDNTDGLWPFDLESKNEEVLNGQDPMIFTVTYHASQADADAGINALVSPYINLTNPQEIFVNITNTQTGCDIATESFFIEVQESAEANSDGDPIVYSLCDDNMEADGNPSNDSVLFDLTQINDQVLDGQDPADYTVSYYLTEADAELSQNALPSSYENEVNPQTIWVRVDNDTTPDDICYGVTSITLEVLPIPVFDLDDQYILCIDTNGTEEIDPPILVTGLTEPEYSFQWQLSGTDIGGATGPSYAPTQGGEYTVIVTDSATGCQSTDTATVIESAPPQVTAEVTSELFSDSNVIVATATGPGTYEYSLNGGPWQESGTFTDVPPGEHVITARDINGCGIASTTVLVIDYPLYFTPNGDGYNDTWNIVGISTQPSAIIYIFDRYGKLLKQLSPTGEGWNGTYNGSLLPSSDYWFVVEYNEPLNNSRKQFRAHFALKR